jgi:hypothetical protein
MISKSIILVLLALATTAHAAPRGLRTAYYSRGGAVATDTHFTVTFVTGAPPTNVVLHADYAGPAVAAQAEYDAGNGVWTSYTSKTIVMQGSYLKLRGDWRTAAGTYNSMFRNSFAGAAYTCEFSGTLGYAATASSAYQKMFLGCTKVTAIRNNPFQPIAGSPAVSMFDETFADMSGVTNSLPATFLDTSALTGSPAQSMLRYACYNLKATGSLPVGFMDTSGLTGAPAVSMYRAACYLMSNVIGGLPAGFLDMSGLTGEPTTFMFNLACRGMAKITSGDFVISTNVTLSNANIVGPLTDAWRGMAEWTGQVYWGTNVIHTVLTPDSRITTFLDSTKMPDYATINANWK